MSTIHVCVQRGDLLPDQGAKLGLDLLALIVTRLKIQVDKVTARKVDSTIVRNEEAWDKSMDGSGSGGMDASGVRQNWWDTKWFADESNEPQQQWEATVSAVWDVVYISVLHTRAAASRCRQNRATRAAPARKGPGSARICSATRRRFRPALGSSSALRGVVGGVNFV